MMVEFSFHRNHRLLVGSSVVGFLALSFLVAILPAYHLQSVEPLPMQQPLTELERQGLRVYVSEGCVACHTQQVRNIEMDALWGDRPSVPGDYYYSKQRLDLWRQSPSVLGSERTGPDLTNIGLRQPDDTWHLIHLFNPRHVVKESIMPGYPWLFNVVDVSSVGVDDVAVPVQDQKLSDAGKKVVATDEVLALVAYLKSLRQVELPPELEPAFIPAQGRHHRQAVQPSDNAQSSNAGDLSQSQPLPDGRGLYLSTCAACHQPEGTGIPGAFPPLAGSPIVNAEDPAQLINTVLNGYDARVEYGVMPPFKLQLSDAEIAAILTHERSSWGNNASPVSEEQVALARQTEQKEQE